MKCFRLAKVKAKGKKPVNQTPAIEPISETGQTVRVALGRGHTQKKQGADNYKGESEWEYYGRIIPKVKRQIHTLAPGKFVTLQIDRAATVGYSTQCRDSARKAELWNADIVVLCHFNSAGRNARGVENLIIDTSDHLDNKLAKIFSDFLNEELGIKERGKDGVKVIKSRHNGYGMLNAMRKKSIPSVLIEPCFAKYENEESRAIFEDDERFADILARAIIKSVTI
jgi:N-acetylmuramoyl-L-alanine amidase